MAATKSQKTITRIVITDPAIIRKVAEEQRREGGRTATGTAGRIIDKYFAIRSTPVAGTTS
jgi:hypothetical protein